MAFSFGFFADPALTTPVDFRVAIRQALGSATPGDICLWFGSPVVGSVCELDADPGVSAIPLSVVNATPGSGSPVTDIRLALSAASLFSATPGAPLALPVTVQGGSENAIAIHVRVSNSLTTTGQRDNLSLTLPLLLETPP